MRTGADFRDVHTLDDGTRIVVRHIRPADANALRAGFHRLSHESRYRRFLQGMPDLSPSTLRYLTEVDGENHVALVAVLDPEPPEDEAGVGVARFIRLADEPSVAEAAITIVDEMQRKGVGRILATTLSEAARERNITHFRAEVLSSNRPIHELIADLGATKLVEAGTTEVLDIPIEPESLVGRLTRILHEAATDAVAFARGRLVRATTEEPPV